MNIAFFTHDVGIYGAARSLSCGINAIINNQLEKNENIYLFYNSGIHKRIDPSSLFDKITNKIPMILPFSFLYQGSKGGRFEIIKACLRYLIFLFLWIFIYKDKLKEHNIQVMHLNSLVLWPMLIFKPKNIRVCIHIRELFDNERFPTYCKFARWVIEKRSDAIIAIDNLSAMPFIDSKKLVILKNPFDMSKTFEIRKDKLEYCYKKYNLDCTKKYVALIGRLDEIKGIHIFLELARRMTDIQAVRFLLVGKAITSYGERMIKEAEKLSNVSYLGEIEHIEEVYALTDIVVRCENFLPLGRTVWEAYYAGCKVLLPYRQRDCLKEIQQIVGQGLYLFKAGNFDEMIQALNNIIGQKNQIQKSKGNDFEYAIEWMDLLRNIK